MNIDLTEIEEKQAEWEDNIVKKSLESSPEREIRSELPRQRLYTPEDVADLDYLRDLGFPGEYPYTRGLHPTMYRSRLWGIAQYSGFGMAEDTNKRWKALLKEGQEGVSLACDLPTQLGYDSDNPLVEPEVAVVGVACPSLKEVETLFDGIPMDEISIGGSTCHPHIILWAMYMAAAEKKGIPSDKLSGNVNNSVLNEHAVRGNYIFSPEGAIRLSLDFMEYGLKHIPRLSYVVANAYSYREAGSTLVQEGAFGLAEVISLIEAALERGIDVDDFAPRIAFNISAQLNFFEEAAKYRALRRLWARIMKERFGAKKPTSLQFRFGVGTSGATLTAQQAENNIVRVTLEALGAILGGAHYLHTSSFDEGYAIPSERAVTIALRTQQILAYESGVADVVDPLGGSYYVEALTDKIEEEIVDYLKKIDATGGMVKAIESGWVQKEVARSAYLKQRKLEKGESIVVGVNRYVSEEKPTFELHKSDPKVVEEIRKRLAKLRGDRDNSAVQHSLEQIHEAAQCRDNLVPFVLDAVKNYATIGEICDVFRDVFGEYEPPAFVG